MKHKTARPYPFNLALVGGIVLVVMVSYVWRIVKLEHNYSYDQGIHLILARLWAADYTPYQEIFISYPPVFMWSMGLPWKIFNRPEALQLLMATYAIAGVVAIVYLGAVYNSVLAGVIAGLLLSLAPPYFDRSITIMAEVPAVGVGVAAVAMAETYRHGGSWGWLVAAGSTLAISLSLKILPFYAVPYLGLVVVARFIEPGSWSTSKKRLLASRGTICRDMLILAGSFLLVFLLPVIFFNPAAVFDQVVAMRLVSREAQFNPLTSNNKGMIGFVFSNPGIMALALYGLVFVVAKDIKRYWLLLVWFGLIWISMYFHVPLRSKHLPILLPVLALFAGFAVNHMVGNFSQVVRRPFSAASLALLLAMLVVAAMFIWNVSTSLAGDGSGPRDEDEIVLAENQAALEFISNITSPADCVVADDPVFLYHTNRLPPPELAEVSHTRIRTGYLTFADMVSILQRHGCYVVVSLTPRFSEEIPGLSDWLADNYLGLHREGEVQIHFAPKFGSHDYVPLRAIFADQLELEGVHFAGSDWSEKQPGYISLFWQAEGPPQSDLLERIELRQTENGGPGLEIERPLFAGASLSPHWQPGETVRDSFRLVGPDSLAPGVYQVYLSVCMAGSPECLPVNNQTGEAFYLGQITVSGQ